MQKGIVIKSTGSWYQVKLTDQQIVKCRIVGRFRLDGLKVTNPVAVGDEVQVEVDASQNDITGTIRKILPRRNYVVRQSPRKKHAVHLLASNVDQAVLIVTVVHPMLKQGFIDRFLLMTEPYNIPTIIVFNKADLYEAGDLNVFNYLKEIYENIGYTVLLVSAVARTGIDELKSLLLDKTSLISGQSGVGKSTLVNSMEVGLQLRTQEISDSSGKGMHTTTFAEMHPLQPTGAIIDTPGIKTLGFNNLRPQQVAHNFRDIFKYSSDCKYSDCMHRNEPQCAVKAAVEADEISELRYTSYLTLLQEVEEQNYWERHNM